VADGHFHTQLNVSPTCIATAAAIPPFPAGSFLDSDSDGYCNITEVALGSNPGNPGSKPEALAVPTTCSDGVDNDADGNADLADGAGGFAAPNGCQTGVVHDVKLSNLSGKKNVNSGQTANYKTVILASGETVQMGIIVDPISGGGCSFTGSPAADPVSNVTGSSNVTTSVSNEGPINIDGDPEVEWFVKLNATQAVVAGVDSGQVTFDVTFPVCPTLGRVANYNISVDVCHGDDIAPLGLFGSGACAAPADGAQDLNSGNDAVITRTIK